MSSEKTSGPSAAKALALLYEQERSGIIEATLETGSIRIHIDAGKVIDVEMADGSSWKLGDFLLESAAIAENVMDRMVLLADKRGEPLEKVLINKNIISEGLLSRFIELHIKETILPVLLQTGVKGRFLEGTPRANPYIQPIAVPFLLKTAAARQRLWPALRERIPHAEMVFARVPGYEDLALAPVLNPGREEDENAGYGLTHPNERLVYYFVNGKKTVHQLAYATCLGEFESASALCRLMDRGYVHVVAEKGRGEKLRKKRVLVPLLFRTVAYGLTAFVVGGLIVERPGALKEPEVVLADTAPHLAHLVKQRYTGRLEHALSTYLLMRGSYPKDLDTLVAAGLISAFDLEKAGANERVYSQGNPAARHFKLTDEE
jgi:hypothetical protein